MSQRGKSEVQVSIIVPSYKEGANVKPLVTRVFAAFEKKNKKDGVELIFVDDNSRDGSEEEVLKLGEKYPVRIVVRTKERGLSSAVIRGFTEAKGKILLCMDADLQHPPESVPDLVDAITRSGADMVIGTRYGAGVAIDRSWPLYRRIISVGARMLSRPLTPLSDPMTGFFGIRKEVFQKGEKNMNNVGFKICLEAYVKCGCKSSVEVPFSFGVRTQGESKLTGAVMIKYLQQLSELYQYKYPYLLYILVLLILAVLALFLYFVRTTLSS